MITETWSQVILRIVGFFWKLLYKNEMDTQIEQIFELFQSLLANLNLPENIFGYFACLLLLTIILAAKTIILSCVVKKLRYCITTPAQFDIYDCDDLEIV